MTEIFRDTDIESERAIREWRTAGGKVVGYVSNTVPLEMIHAAGMLPYHLHGDPEQETELADRFMEPAFDPVTRSILQRILNGDFPFVDAIVLPRSNDSFQRLYYYLCELRRNHPAFNLPPVHLCDLLHSPGESRANHNRRALEALAGFLAHHAGRAIADSALEEAIDQYNLARRQLQAFNLLRARRDLDVPSSLAYRVYAAARSLPVAQFNEGMRDLIRTVGSAAPTGDHPRFILAGTALDHPALHQAADQLGARIVGDYHALGNHFLVSRVKDHPDPLTALSRHYHLDTRSCRSFLTEPGDVAAFAQSQDAGGILFFYLQGEEALTWHYPKQVEAAREAGLQTLALRQQNYALDAETLLSTMQAFLDRL